MSDVDFLTNVESAFLALFASNKLLAEYNWQRWDSDKELELPRGVIGLSARRDPEETPYRRISVMIKFEGRPEKQTLTTVMHELVNLLETTQPSELSDRSKGTVTFMGKAITVAEDRPIVTGLRTWTHAFVIYGVPS